MGVQPGCLKKFLTSGFLLCNDIFCYFKHLTNFLLFQNSNICTSLPEEIKLFHDLSSIDVEEFVQNLGPLREEIVSRMSFCRLNSKEEYDVCISNCLKQFKLESLRFDKLILVEEYQRSTSEEENKVDIKNNKMENNENLNNEDNELEMKTNVQRMRSCKSNDSEATLPAFRPNIVIDTSCNNASAYDCDPRECCVIGKSISREDFKSKHSYITAWAECQSETCLNRDSADSVNSNNGEDTNLDAISVVEKFSDDCSERNSLLAAEIHLSTLNAKVTAEGKETPSKEIAPLSNNVYADCVKSVISDHVKQSAQPIHNTINKGLIRTQEESESNISSDLKRYDKMSLQSVLNTVDSNGIGRVTQSCSEKLNGEACRTSNEILSDRESHNIFDEAKVRQCLKITLIHKGCGIWAVKTTNNRKRSQCESDNCTESKNNPQTILEEGANQHYKKVKLTLADDSSPQNTRLNLDKKLKNEVTCRTLAVKTLNKRKRSKSESDNCTESKNNTQAILEERANQHCKKVKLTLADDSSSQNAKLIFDKNLKHEPVLGCGTLAVKILNKRKRSESESENRTISTNDALAIIEGKAKQGCKVPKRMKLISAQDNFSENAEFTLPEDSSSKNLKQEPIRKKKVKSLRRLARAIGAMKSRIVNRPMLRRVATIRPFLI